MITDTIKLFHTEWVSLRVLTIKLILINDSVHDFANLNINYVPKLSKSSKIVIDEIFPLSNTLNLKSSKVLLLPKYFPNSPPNRLPHNSPPIPP